MKLRSIAGEKARNFGIAEQIPSRHVPVSGRGFWVGTIRQFSLEQFLGGVGSAFPIQPFEKSVPPAAVKRGQIVGPRNRSHFVWNFRFERARREFADEFRSPFRCALKFSRS